MHALAKHSCDPINWNHYSPLPSSSIGWGWPPFFINDFHLETDLLLNRKTFISTLTHSPCLSFGSPLGTVYELLWDCFVLDDFINGFDYFFDIRKHITRGHVPPSISCLHVALWIIGFGKTNRTCSTHCDWRSDLLIDCSHIGNLVQGYICKAI